MRILVAGASGAIGSRLVPQLVERGHEVIGTYRTPGKGDQIRALGAQPVQLDLLDPNAVRQAVLAAEPDAIAHEATALTDVKFGRRVDRAFAGTNRLRTEGTDALLAAATVLALEHGEPGIYNVVDDEPALVREWLPVLASALDAGPPRRVPRWLAWLVGGDLAVVMGTETRGASAAKAKRELGWTLRHPSWREGFVAAYGSLAHAA